LQDLIVVKEIKEYCDTIEVGDYFILRGGRSVSFGTTSAIRFSIPSFLFSRRSGGSLMSLTIGCPVHGR